MQIYTQNDARFFKASFKIQGNTLAKSIASLVQNSKIYNKSGPSYFIAKLGRAKLLLAEMSLQKFRINKIRERKNSDHNSWQRYSFCPNLIALKIYDLHQN